MYNIDRLVMHLRFEEGFEKEPYFDTKKIKTIGTGLNLEEAWPDKWLDFLGVEDEDDITHITKAEDKQIVIWHLEDSVEDLKELFDEVWDDISDLRQEMLIAMRFQLGMPRFKGFRKLIAAVKNDDWLEAGRQILDSKAAREDAPARWNRIAKAVETNDEKHLELEKLFDEPADAKDSKYKPEPENLPKEVNTQGTQDLASALLEEYKLSNKLLTRILNLNIEIRDLIKEQNEKKSLEKQRKLDNL